MNLKKFNQLKSKLSKLVREHAKIEGSLEHDVRQLEQEFGCTSLKKGEVHLSELKEDEQKLAKHLKKKTEAFEKKWKEILDE